MRTASKFASLGLFVFVLSAGLIGCVESADPNAPVGGQRMGGIEGHAEPGAPRSSAEAAEKLKGNDPMNTSVYRREMLGD